MLATHHPPRWHQPLGSGVAEEPETSTPDRNNPRNQSDTILIFTGTPVTPHNDTAHSSTDAADTTDHRHRLRTRKKPLNRKKSRKTWNRGGGDGTPPPPPRAHTTKTHTRLNNPPTKKEEQPTSLVGLPGVAALHRLPTHDHDIPLHLEQQQDVP